MKNRFQIYSIALGLILFASCQKVINIDIKDADKRIVVEGTITDEPGLISHSIFLSRTKNFSSDNSRDPVVGAMVVVEDATSKIKDTLIELYPGQYVTQNTYGISGHTYNLTANISGANYTASSTMPDAVPFDSLYSQDLSFFGSVVTQLIPVFQDPVGTKNYYRFGIQINDSVQKTLEGWDDQLSDGKINSRPLNVENQDWFRGKDSVTVTMNCTDKGTFDFFNTLINASGNGQTPANPTSNISGNAIGYFSALTVRKKTIYKP